MLKCLIKRWVKIIYYLFTRIFIYLCNIFDLIRSNTKQLTTSRNIQFVFKTEEQLPHILFNIHCPKIHFSLRFIRMLIILYIAYLNSVLPRDDLWLDCPPYSHVMRSYLILVYCKVFNSFKPIEHYKYNHNKNKQQRLKDRE